MAKKRKGFRVIKNKALIEQDAGRRRITADDVREVWLAGQAEERQMAEICPEFNDLMELVWQRIREAITPARLAQDLGKGLRDDNMNLWCRLMEARMTFFDHRAWLKQAQLKVKK